MTRFRTHRGSLFAALTAAISLVLLSAMGVPPVTVRIKASDHTAIQKAIDRLPPAGGTVLLLPGRKPVRVGASIVIDRNNVTLEGEGRVELRLADGVNQPVLILGQTRAEPTVTRTNIHVRNLIINGNRAKQTSELHPYNRELRNNGLSLRRVEDCSVERVGAFACRSGGLVTELGCRRLTVRDFEAYDNYFDGLACYHTEDSVFSGLKLHHNLAAGISLDIDFARNVIRDSVLTSNRSVGVFIRDSRDNVFSNLLIEASGEHGFFLAQVDMDATTPATGNQFQNCRVRDCGGAGIRVNNATCVNNSVITSEFTHNACGGFSEVTPGLLKRDDLILD